MANTLSKNENNLNDKIIKHKILNKIIARLAFEFYTIYQQTYESIIN